jgi:hypothetical protein
MDELHSQGDGTKTTLSFSRDKERPFVSSCKPPGFSKKISSKVLFEMTIHFSQLRKPKG